MFFFKKKQTLKFCRFACLDSRFFVRVKNFFKPIDLILPRVPQIPTDMRHQGTGAPMPTEMLGPGTEAALELLVDAGNVVFFLGGMDAGRWGMGSPLEGEGMVMVQWGKFFPKALG